MSASRSLRERIAGQSAMSDVVLAQSAVPARSGLARVFGSSPLTATSRASYNGALGELLVGDVLENLGSNWDVLHDLPLRESDEGEPSTCEHILDHLLIGPAGVFAVHVTNFTDRDVTVVGDQLLVGGEVHHDIDCAHAQAAASEAILSAASGSPVTVFPLLVVVEPRRVNVRVAAVGARVIASYQLDRFLSKAPRTLSGTEIARISDLADLATTWPEAPDPSLDVQNLHQRFAVVRNQVRSALLRRVLWGTAGVAIVYSAVWLLVASLVSAIIKN
ncbi:MAG: nuclease-related domain-containing protein [Rhodoglobus sp.]